MDKFGEEYIEILNTFYQLKNQYQESFRTKYVQPIVQMNGSKNEKRKKYINLPKPKCVNCKRNVGTLFKIENLGISNGKKYIIKCGDEKEPCPLSVIFTIPNSVNINKEFDILNPLSLQNSLKGDKENIIELKNDGMFGFLNKDEIKSKFFQLNKEIQETSKLYDEYLTFLIKKTMPPEKEDELKKIKEEFEINKQIFQEYIVEYKITNDNNIITNAIEFYISSLMPLSQQISTLSYNYRFIEEKEPNIFYLQLKKNSISQMEIYYGKFNIEQNKVGMLNISKTIKRKKTPNPKTKTKKNIIINESNDSDDVEELFNKLNQNNTPESEEDMIEIPEEEEEIDPDDSSEKKEILEGEIDWGDSSEKKASNILKEEDIINLEDNLNSPDI